MAGGALLNPASFVQGGLIDDVDVTVQESRFTLYDYDGKSQQPTLALHWKLVDDEGIESDQYWSAGDPKFFVPSKDGKEAVPVGSRTALAGGSNFAILMASIVNAGFPPDDLGSDISVFDGMKVHVGRVAQPKRSGIINRGGDDSREKTVLTVTKILAMPGQAPVTKAAGGAKTGTAKAAAGTKAAGTTKSASAPAAAASAPDGDLDATLADVVMEVLAEKGEVSKKDLSGHIFRAAQFAGNLQLRNAAVKRVFSDEFLQAGPWQFDGSTVSLG